MSGLALDADGDADAWCLRIKAEFEAGGAVTAQWSAGEASCVLSRASAAGW
jgi:hypothetical protein